MLYSFHVDANFVADTRSVEFVSNTTCHQPNKLAEEVEVFDIDKFYTKAEYSPFDGLSYKGKATMTFVGGELIMENDEVYSS